MVERSQFDHIGNFLIFSAVISDHSNYFNEWRSTRDADGFPNWPTYYTALRHPENAHLRSIQQHTHSKLCQTTHRKRLSAEKTLQHPWMVARKTNNLNSSTSSLDSALCLDSASSMEPSPVSSASSSFSPAPSAASRNTNSGATSTSTSIAALSYSQPADIGKVNEKLSQISTLATERLVAENASRPRPEGSPASDSSTSTLKGDEVTETIPILVKEPSTPDIGKETSKHGSVRHKTGIDGIEAIDGRKTKAAETEGKGGLGRKGSLQAKFRTLDRGFSTNEFGSLPVVDKDDRRSSTLTRCTSNQSTSRDLTSLNPKTIESLEKYRKLKEVRVRMKTPEPVSPDVPEAKLLSSPERHLRRKSVGMHPIERRVDVKGFIGVQPTVLEEHPVSMEKTQQDKPELKVTPRGSPSPTKMTTSPSATRRLLTPSPTKMASSPGLASSPSPSPTKLPREEDGVWRQPKAEDRLSPDYRRSQFSPKREVDLSPELPRKRASPPLFTSERRRSSGSSTTSKTSPTSLEPPRSTEGREKRDKDRLIEGGAKTLVNDVSLPFNGRRSREGRLKEKEEENDRLRTSTTTRRKTTESKPETLKPARADKTTPTLKLPSTSSDIPIRQKSPIPDRMKVVKANRRMTPVISIDALDAILRGEIPEDELVTVEGEEGDSTLSGTFLSQRKTALEACPEEDESQKSPERARRHSPHPDPTRAQVTSSSSPSGHQTMILVETSPDRPRSPEKRANAKSPTSRRDFTESLSVHNVSERRQDKEASGRFHSVSGLSPDKALSPKSPATPDPFSCSFDAKTMPSRLRAQSMMHSRSTPDLTEIGGRNDGNTTKKGKRVERSSSRRLKNRFTRLGGGDSYITDTSVHHSSHNSSYRSGRGTLPTKMLSGSSISQAFSPFSRKHRERDSNKSSRVLGSNTDGQ